MERRRVKKNWEEKMEALIHRRMRAREIKKRNRR
jgi:hypothetical protein